MTTPRESHHLDRKSLRLVAGAKPDFGDIAQACVCFANASGGALLIGIEDDAEAPSADQRSSQRSSTASASASAS